MADIDKDLKTFMSGIEEDVLGALKSTIRELVDKARAKTSVEGGFNNITWNLRESIGGVVVKDHEIVDTYFPEIGKGPDGRKKGIALAQEVALLTAYDDQFIALFVAGEEYAVFVEAKDRDVITHSSLAFGELFEQFMKNQKNG